MKEVIIIGAGGHGAELDEYIQLAGQTAGSEQFKILGFLDDNPENYHRYQFSAPLLGGVREHRVRTDCFYMIGIANLKYRRFFVEQFLARNARFLSFIHPTACVSPTAHVGTGSIVGPHVNLGPNVKVGRFNLLNARCSLGHDTELGDYNFICPNVCFSGFSKVGNDNLFGINSATIPEMVVGHRNQIAAGMVISQPVADDAIVFYRYKEKIMVQKVSGLSNS